MEQQKKSTDEDPLVTDGKKTLFGLNIETGLFLALLTAGSYYISSFYVSVYFGRLGIPMAVLDYSIDEIIVKGVGLLVFSIVLSLILWKEMEYSGKWSIYNWFLCNIPFYLWIYANVNIIFNPILDFPKYVVYLGIFLIGLCLVILIITYSGKFSLLQFMWRREIASKLIAIFIILSGFGFYAMISGDFDAIKLIECDDGSCSHINFTFKDQNLSYINSEKLILITQHDGKYILSKQEKPMPKNPEIYIVYSDQISSVRMKMVRNWSDQKETAFF